jgi:hypothetical protein
MRTKMPKGWFLGIDIALYYASSKKEALKLFGEVVALQVQNAIEYEDLLEMSAEAEDFHMPDTIPEDWNG